MLAAVPWPSALKSAGAVAATSAVVAGFVERHRVQAGDVSRDRWWSSRARAVLTAATLVPLLLLGWYLLSPASPARRAWTPAEAAALAAALLGAALRLWAMRALGRLFTFEVAIRRGHALVGDGPYRWLRHPSYTGAIVGLGGLMYYLAGPHAVLRDWRVWAAGAPLGALVIGARVVNEEQALGAHFGKAWERHCRTRWRLVPLVW